MASTFFITDQRMLEHKCEWDRLHVDGPERLKCILETLKREKVLDECEILISAECSIDDLRLVHSEAHITRIQQASGLASHEKMEQYCKGLEDIYLNEHSWQSAQLAAGCAVKAMQAVLKAPRPADGRAPNAFAAIRPPGHHASRDAPCGFCIFNNVSICAKKARQMGVERVLIIDWDIHAGQGTQYCVDGDPGILLISAHRYEHGQFWPELPECGIRHKYGNTINVPLNQIGYGDAEYAALMHFFVLPVIQQWRPGLILVSCGFDAALGDSIGEMEVSPAGFGYMTGLLAQLGIPLCLLLEGGYFLQSVVQGTLFCMRALLQRAPPVINFCEHPPAPSFLQTLYAILLTTSARFPFFQFFIRQLNLYRLGISTTLDKRRRRRLPQIRMSNKMEIESYEDNFFGDRELVEMAIANSMYPTRGEYPPREPALEQSFLLKLQQLLDQYAKETTERIRLDFELDNTHPDGKMLLMYKQNDGENASKLFLSNTIPATSAMANGNGNGSHHHHNHNNCCTTRVLFPLNDADHFMLIYYYLLLPLDFTYFSVRLEGCELPLVGNKLAELLNKFDGNEQKMNGDGGKVANGMDVKEEDEVGEEGGLDHAMGMDLFLRLKPFFQV